ncbi:MAG TPA: protein-glutamate O-methyltransferase CheR [Candidatus Angelobacter sp.]|nr:protein-glutamate O-methyltransferase CheR [Candidatus Angelobacter sp.]
MQEMDIDSKPAAAHDASLLDSSARSYFQLLSSGISEREFLRLRDLIYRDAGIWLSQSKTALLVGRLAKRLRHHGLKSFKQYYDLVANSPEERIQMLDALSTNETRFFREPQHFELLKSVIFPKWAQEVAAACRSRKIRVLSAGCSTGQEPYSLAMVLLDHFPAAAGWEIEITATDLSTRALEIARAGIWPAAKAVEIPSPFLKAFMLKGFADQAGKMRAGPEIRSIVQFFRMNLNEPAYPLAGKFDLIFCRNVLIYFDLRSRERVVRRLASFLSPDGYFFLGHAESLHAMSDCLRTVVPTVYIEKDDVPKDAKP